MMLSAVQRFTVLDYPDKIACIAFTPGCNMRCGFCHNPEFVLPEKLQEIRGSFISEKTFFHFLKGRQSLLEGVVVSGGEPTIWQDLPAFLGKVKKLGFLVKLDTNGNHPEMLERVLREKLVDYVAMDVKTALEEYSKLVGPNVKKENILKSITLLKSKGVPYEFRTTLIKEHHTPAVIQKMRELLKGGDQLFLQAFRPAHTLDPLFSRYHPFSLGETKEIEALFQGALSRVALRG
ncbi:MAG: anaerobic ribonucleoside-triphosphate reductase activating protein [Candidatus Moraniibacteriota bacterium]